MAEPKTEGKTERKTEQDGVLEVLLGHRVQPTVPPDRVGPDAGNTVSPDELDHLLSTRQARKALRCADLEQLFVSKPPGGPVRRSAQREGGFLVTFDDGYRDNLTDALPVLERHGAPAIVFVTTGFVARTGIPAETRLAHVIESCHELRASRGRRFDCSTAAARAKTYDSLRTELKRAGGARRDQRIDGLYERNGVERLLHDDRFLDWDGVRELDRHPLVTIGAHTRTHALLTSVSRDEAWLEIEGGKLELERELGHPVDTFAYPYGGNGLRVRRLVERAGFRWAFTTEPRVVDATTPWRPLEIPRIDMRVALCAGEGRYAG